jgi:hypothetical protein
MTIVKVLKCVKARTEENVALTLHDLNSIYHYLQNNGMRIYDNDSKLKMIKRLLKDVMDQNNEIIRNEINRIMTTEMYQWKIDQLSPLENEFEIYATLTADRIQNIPFRGKPQLISESAFGSFRIQIYADKFLIFLFGPYVYISLFQKVIRKIFKENGLDISVVTWDSDALNQIKQDDSSMNLEERIDNIEARVTVDMSASDGLENTQLSDELEAQGQIRSVKYVSREYPNNTVKIDGAKGIVNTDLDETQTIQYIKEKLLRYSNYWNLRHTI